MSDARSATAPSSPDIWPEVPRRPWSVPRRRTVVVVPHPDDEALGTGALIASQRTAGVEVVVVAVTDGEAAFPTAEPADLAAVRRDEQASSLAVLGVDAAAVVRLGWPDGHVAEHEDELAAQLTALVRADDLLVAPWPGDHHPDHEVCGRAASRAAAERGCELVHSLVWAPVRVPAASAPPFVQVVRLDASAVDQRRRAVAAHGSQLDPGSGGPVVTADLLARMDVAEEWYVAAETPALDARPVERTSGSFFEAMYRASDDPWSFASDAAELERYDRIVDLVGPGPVGATFEPGCSVGVLTEQLAARCDEVWAIDVSPTAVLAAQRRCARFDHVHIAAGRLPGDTPPGPFELIVFSEIGYYFERDELAVVLGDLMGRLGRGGRLVSCHWRGRSPDHVLSGDTVHDVITSVAGQAGLDGGVEERWPGYVLGEWVAM